MGKAKRFLQTLKSNYIFAITAVVVIIFTASAFFFFWKGKSNTIPIEDAEAITATENGTEKNSSEDKTEKTVYVDISGCVKNPGVYEVAASSRVFEVIEKAGGVTKNADTSYINQAEPVSDGQKIDIPDKNADIPVDTVPSGNSTEQDNDRININTAGSEELQRIPGIGPVTAEKIISYRESNGYFKSIDDIKNVSGIGEKTFEKIKDTIVLTGGSK